MITDIHHFSFTVRNMDESLNFYTEILDGCVLSDVIIQESTKHSVTGIPDARLRIVFLSAFGRAIELIQYLSPVGKPLETCTYDAGSAHIAFIVDDMESTYHEFQSKGVQFKSEPLAVGSTPGTIVKCVYFLDPDGITLELVEIG